MAFPLPIYNGDIEDAGMPDKVRELQALFAKHDSFLHRYTRVQRCCSRLSLKTR